ncbi:hypothetical protein KR009_010962 [Drosophila setifemur]|nr:hypothetical protein KR009_010962 [Drosophila setifemur]
MFKFLILLTVLAVLGAGIEARRSDHHEVRHAVERRVARRVALHVLRRALPLMIMDVNNYPFEDSQDSSEDAFPLEDSEEVGDSLNVDAIEDDFNIRTPGASSSLNRMPIIRPHHHRK